MKTNHFHYLTWADHTEKICKMKKIFFISLSVLTSCICFSQENIFTAGFQYKPIFSSSLFNTVEKSITQNNINFSVSQKFGFCAGMVIRRGFTKRFSLESGINYVKRNYNLKIADTSFTGKSDFTIIGYEIPVLGLIYIRIAKKIFMNTSLGISWDMYPSNITTGDSYFKHTSTRHSLFQGAALANLGYEYRTEKSGYFYWGASYHLPFTEIFNSSITYEPKQEIAKLKIPGNYLTLDFRYFFHEEPLKQKKKKKKKK